MASKKSWLKNKKERIRAIVKTYGLNGVVAEQVDDLVMEALCKRFMT